MDSFWFYLQLGFQHVLDPNGLDHFFFLIVLALPFGWRKGRALVTWVTLFTLGHTFALWAAYEEWITLSGAWVEFLIPITISWMSLTVLIQKKKAIAHKQQAYRLGVTTLVFGLIHGLGFGRYFSQIVLEESAYGSLFQFALGVEFAQLLIVLGVVLVNLLVLDLFRWKAQKWQWIVAAMVLSQALRMTIENYPG
ncbi:MAG: HupE/UreJ family protein [Flavobacteriaceae bacterium]|jgi:hypothetical protein